MSVIGLSTVEAGGGDVSRPGEAELEALLEAIDTEVAGAALLETEQPWQEAWGQPRAWPPGMTPRTGNTFDELVGATQLQLNRRFRVDDAAGIQDRRSRLIRLFSSAEPWDAAALYQRLLGLVPKDPLARLFRYSLATPTRQMLLRILKRRGAGAMTL